MEAILHYNDVIMSAMAHQMSSLTIVYSTVYSGADQRKHQSSGSLAFVKEIQRWPVNSPHKGPVTWKLFSIDDVIMVYQVMVAIWDFGSLFDLLNLELVLFNVHLLFCIICNNIHCRRSMWKYRLQNVGHLGGALMCSTACNLDLLKPASVTCVIFE